MEKKLSEMMQDMMDAENIYLKVTTSAMRVALTRVKELIIKRAEDRGKVRYNGRFIYLQAKGHRSAKMSELRNILMLKNIEDYRIVGIVNQLIEELK